MHNEKESCLKGIGKSIANTVKKVPVAVWITITIAALQQIGAPDLAEFAVDCAPDIIEAVCGELIKKIKEPGNGAPKK